MPDINRDVSIEQVDYTIDVNNIEYSIEINPQQTFELQLNEQGPQGLTGPQGETGETGNGISSITQTGTSGLIDTYTIYYTDGDTTTFDVTNGKDGEDGADGFSPIATVTQTTTGATVTITDKNGTTTADILNGIDGTDGQDGQAATISVGTVSTGAAGTSASVVNSGTSSAAVFDFVIPQGAKGDTGNTGATGISVTGVSLISTVGLVKTYRMSFSDGSYFDYTVTDGASGSTTWGGIRGVLSNQTDLNNALNSKADTTAIPTATSDLINDSGYITGITSSDVTTALGYTPYNSSNPSGYISSVPTATTSSLGVVQPDGTTITINNGVISGASSVDIDNLSITENSSDELQTIGVIDQNNTTNAIKTWTGTSAQAPAVGSRNATTLYNITDDVTNNNSIVVDLNNKADLDLTNCTVPVVVSRTPNNQGGIVEIWSDGYCIQTGVVIRSTQDIAITLDQSYNDTNYIITALSTNNSGVSGSMTMIDSSGTKTVSGFILITNFNGTVPTANIQTMWRTEGYIR